jgi:competence protein ComFC
MRAVRYALDTIAPPDPLIREIENMTPAEFERRVSGIASRRPDGVIAFFPYRNEVMRKTLVELKDFRNRKIERLIGGLMCARLLAMDGMHFEHPLLVPVPMTKKALRKRGWNQCELIAREISKADRERRIEMRTDVLYKTRDTGDQVGKTREERLASLDSCMTAMDQSAVRDRVVILLDDIVTTGATLGEAKRALLQAGARAVICVAVAF